MRYLDFVLTVVTLTTLLACSKSNDDVNPQIVNQLSPLVSQSAKYEVKITNAVEYAKGLSHSEWGSATTTAIPLLLDIFEPQDAPDNRPAIVLIHGGGLNFGSRKDPNIVNVANYFATRGWVVFSLDYRLKGDKGTVPSSWQQYALANTSTMDTFEEIMKIYPANRDVKAAIRWVYSNADNYSINTDYITVGGGSAGALLSVTLGVTEEQDYRDELTDEEDPTLPTTNLDQPSKVHTIIDFWGGSGYVTALRQIYGLQRFDATDAPILIAHGTNDQTVNFSNAENLRDTYEATGVQYEFYPLTGYDHSAWEAKVNGISLEELALDFVIKIQNLQLE